MEEPMSSPECTVHMVLRGLGGSGQNSGATRLVGCANRTLEATMSSMTPTHVMALEQKVMYWMKRSNNVLLPVHFCRATGGFGGDKERCTDIAVIKRSAFLVAKFVMKSSLIIMSLESEEGERD